eukprot:Nitzschia sp. Nitz4//scaffold27_size158506//54819//58530//NITZ4_002596-RA/size158506-snap-gene-0.215-mRNA-1//-1//CDS//3329545476//7552//frame0
MEVTKEPVLLSSSSSSPSQSPTGLMAFFYDHLHFLVHMGGNTGTDDEAEELNSSTFQGSDCFTIDCYGHGCGNTATLRNTEDEDGGTEEDRECDSQGELSSQGRITPPIQVSYSPYPSASKRQRQWFPFNRNSGKSMRRTQHKVAVLCLLFVFVLIPTIVVPRRKRAARNSISGANSALKDDAYDDDVEETLMDDEGGFRYDDDDDTTYFFPDDDSYDDDGTGSGAVDNPDDHDTPVDYNLRDLTLQSFGPYSSQDPVDDVGLANFDRSTQTSPSSRLSALSQQAAVPTNAWYQNLLLLLDSETPTDNHRVYTMPYMVDVNGPIPGLRVHSSSITSSSAQVIVSVNDPYAVTLGATGDGTTDVPTDWGYTVPTANDLGITLEWNYAAMTSSLVRGMPFATMTYPNFLSGDTIRPTVYSQTGLFSTPLVDETISQECGTAFTVSKNLELTFTNGLTWLVFFSQPVSVHCTTSASGPFQLQVLELTNEVPLVVRLAMVLPSSDDNVFEEYTDNYKALLREAANVYPGQDTLVQYAMNGDEAALIMDWDAQTMDGSSDVSGMIMYAMPHHQDRMTIMEDYCTPVLLGSVCLVQGSNWTVHEDLPSISFHAPRLPNATLFPDIIEAVVDDLSYQIADNFQRGAGDTYFSGKQLARLSRIIVIAQEVLDLCSSRRRRAGLRNLVSDKYATTCNSVTLPTQEAIDAAMAHLQDAVEVWINGEAQAPFVYDPAWGGVVNCGCTYSNGNCINAYPNCPGLTDAGLNYGFGFYNDHHFHLGYHIHAAAVLAKYNPTWGLENYDKVLLFVRDIANPSLEDTSFPLTRNKDWYHGSSWASGITQPPALTGMNQESTSEAIAGYEAVALYGKVMREIFQDEGDSERQEVCNNIYKMGRLLTATELRSTKRYWQVTESKKLFDSVYEPSVVGILWSSKAWFGTWFGTLPYFMYGIQMIPLTAIAEERDDPEWIEQMFEHYSESCDEACVTEGWSVQLMAGLATLGQQGQAAEYAKGLTNAVFDTAGGNGHSKSNTLWYIATRPGVSEPYTLTDTYEWQEGPFVVTCFQPDTCTDDALEAMAGQYPCGERISYLYNNGMTEYDACYQVAVTEYPSECSPCDPTGAGSSTTGSGGDDEVDEDDTVSNGDDSTTSDGTSDSSYRCNTSTCTDAVLSSLADSLPCGDRIDWLISDRGMSEVQACTVVAAQEFPVVCGGCNPN